MKLTKFQASQAAILMTWYIKDLETFQAAISKQDFEYAAKVRNELAKRIQKDFKKVWGTD